MDSPRSDCEWVQGLGGTGVRCQSGSTPQVRFTVFVSRFPLPRTAASLRILSAAAALVTTGVAAAVMAVAAPSAPVLAQAAPAGKPASQDLINDLVLAAAVNSCDLSVQVKTPMEKSVRSSATAIAYVISSRYGSQIANLGKLQQEQIATGAFIQIVGRIRQGCYTKLGAADKKFIDDVMTEVSKNVKNK